MKFEELQKKDASSLNNMLSENREKLRELRFKDSNKQLKNIREIRATRQLIARIQTVLNKQK